MNAVEVSEYERELTKHKLVKINLEYILKLYLEKYLCLFKYKEIDYDTYFEKLRNTFVLTDEFNFSYYIREHYKGIVVLPATICAKNTILMLLYSCIYNIIVV